MKERTLCFIKMLNFFDLLKILGKINVKVKTYIFKYVTDLFFWW